MNFKELTLASFAAALALSTGCVVDDNPGGDTDGTDTDPTTMTTGPTGPTGPTTMTSGPTTTTSPTGETDTDPTGETDTDPTGDTDTDTDDIDPDLYDFREDEADAYTRVDRMGFPALNTALIPEAMQDDYNAGNPADDSAGTFAAAAVGTLEFLHSTPPVSDEDSTPTPGGVGLNDDLVLANTLLGTSLTPCGVTNMENSCLLQAVPLAFPDVLLLTTGETTGFPNGRTLEVPVIDIILAAVLVQTTTFGEFIDLSSDGDLTDEIYGLSQRPNDVAFPGAFPYLAPAHE